MKIDLRKIIEINNLSVSYGKNLKPTLKNFTLDVFERNHLAIIGSSGCGKSTLVKSIVQMLPEGAIYKGRLLINGRDPRNLNNEALKVFRRSHFGFVYQDSIKKLNPLMSVGEHLFELLKLHFINQSNSYLSKKVVEIFSKVGISSKRLNSFPHEFSGGMRQRVCIALAIALNPKIIIADEPTTSLDAYTSYEIMKQLLRLCDEYSSTLLLVTHDIALASKWCKRIAIIDEGVIAEQGFFKDVMQSTQSNIGKKLLKAASLSIKKLPLSDINSEVVLEVGNLRHWYRLNSSLIKPKWNKAINEISFKLFKNETLGVVGISGSGKSTLGKVLTGLLDKRGGYINTYMNHLSRNKKQKINNAKNIQMIFQDPYSSLNPKMTIKEILEDVYFIHNQFDRKKMKIELISVLKKLNLPYKDIFINQYPNQLSGGQLQRISIARALLIKPRILICDESLNMLDASVKIEILQLLRKIQREMNLSIIFITHDLGLAQKFCNRLLVINEGIIIEEGETKAIFKDPQNKITKTLIECSLSI